MQRSLSNTAALGDSPTRAPFAKLAIVLGTIAVAFVCIARAAEPDVFSAARPIEFSIPAQSLPSALHEYGRKVGVQVLYESRSAADRTSEEVKGRFTPDEALKRLLANTDLQVRHASADAIALVTPTVRDSDLPPANPFVSADLSLGELRVRQSVRPNDLERFADYSEIVRAEIQRALLKNTKSASGNYRAVLDLWIDPTRTIRKAALLHPTGDEVRDAAITTTLQGLVISRPTPTDAPQPLRAVVAVSTAR